MEVIQQFLFRIFATIIFGLAIAGLLSNIGIVEKMTNVTKDAVTEDRNMYAASDDVSTDIDIITCDEVISYIVSGIEYDVEIDGVLLNAVNFDKNNFNYAFIQNDYYRRSYETDGDGLVTKVIFTSVIKS